ncbi:hypothetical protein TKK_0015987 [Trichogramma kaykai]
MSSLKKPRAEEGRSAAWPESGACGVAEPPQVSGASSSGSLRLAPPVGPGQLTTPLQSSRRGMQPAPPGHWKAQSSRR